MLLALHAIHAPTGAQPSHARAEQHVLTPGADESSTRRSGTGTRTALGSAKLASCKYVPSRVEEEWFSSAAAGRICATAYRPHQVQAAKEWLSYVASDRRGAPPASLSKWVCADGATEYIEPLSGIARHPFAGVCPSHLLPRDLTTTTIYDITYLMLANNCSSARGSVRAAAEHLAARATVPRRLLFDLGCSVYGDDSDARGHSHSDVLHQQFGSGYGPSMPLFDSLLAAQCLPLDHMFGWEAEPMNATEWWAHVPTTVRPRLSFFNVPVSAPGAIGWTSASAGGTGDFISRLEREASADDYVAVKLDIDNVPAEQAIMRHIGRPQIARLVDELFFEYHFNFDNLNFGWQSQIGGVHHVNDTVDDALRLMQSMRRKGVRAHFWI